MYHYILFDLDGTLTDSREGIVKSVQFAFARMGRPVPEETELTKFIGPPLQDIFIGDYGFSEPEALQAIEYFRERYAPIGKFENAAAPGMPELCARLKERGFVLALASSKPEELCVSICGRFGFTPYLDRIVGSPLHGDWKKADVIREAFRRLGLTPADRAKVLMVGDRRYDVEGAADCGVDCAGVEFFSYGVPGELERAGAVFVARTAEELERFILSR